MATTIIEIFTNGNKTIPALIAIFIGCLPVVINNYNVSEIKKLGQTNWSKVLYNLAMIFACSLSLSVFIILTVARGEGWNVLESKPWKNVLPYALALTLILTGIVTLAVKLIYYKFTVKKRLYVKLDDNKKYYLVEIVNSQYLLRNKEKRIDRLVSTIENLDIHSEIINKPTVQWWKWLHDKLNREWKIITIFLVFGLTVLGNFLGVYGAAVIVSINTVLMVMFALVHYNQFMLK